jgi:hypothetical protein
MFAALTRVTINLGRTIIFPTLRPRIVSSTRLLAALWGLVPISYALNHGLPWWAHWL